ncbi:hypothetical protein SS05631_c24480 [Sinorhizobium sp. CCBAU 05631]|nr:hypothetical protein SS05631_c24480 [Sinorhizobium sp. CCBAU 05631]
MPTPLFQFWGVRGEEHLPARLSAAGRPSPDPATASKAEKKKKRGKGARGGTIVIVSKGDR